MIELMDKFLASMVETLLLKFAHNHIPKSITKGGKDNFQVIYLSENVLVINKPPDLVINSNDKSKSSVQTILAEQFHDLTNSRLFHDFYFVHRLDYATSGLLCIPLHKKICSEISQLFENRLVEKYYLAILRGHIVGQEDIFIDVPIGEDIRFKTTSNKMCTSHDWEHCLSPRNCVTKILVLERGVYDTEFATKVLLKPVTGRRHQLRVHCHEIGHPIIGDYTYSTHIADSHESMPRMMLHAFRIVIPVANEPLDLMTADPFTASLTKWIGKEVVNRLEDAFDKINLV